MFPVIMEMVRFCLWLCNADYLSKTGLFLLYSLVVKISCICVSHWVNPWDRDVSFGVISMFSTNDLHHANLKKKNLMVITSLYHKMCEKIRCMQKRKNMKNCFDKWIYQPQTGENCLYVTRWVLKRSITCYFPQNLTSAARASQHSLNQTKCGWWRSCAQRRMRMRWKSLSSKLLFLCLSFSLPLKERPWGFEQRVSKKQKAQRQSQFKIHFGVCVRERETVWEREEKNTLCRWRKE